jgi:serine/threonine protein kinase
MLLGVGEKLGPYEITGKLGAGGMGEVWRARDTRLDRAVAIKVSAEKFNARFEREARALAALKHPNICQLYDVDVRARNATLSREDFFRSFPMKTEAMRARVAAALQRCGFR